MHAALKQTPVVEQKIESFEGEILEQEGLEISLALVPRSQILHQDKMCRNLTIKNRQNY